MKPRIFTYQDYRAYLRDLFAFEKNQSESFSYRTFSKRAGVRAPNFLKLVIEGKRNLSPKSIGAVIRAFRLDEEEGSFFRSLVLLNQAKSFSEKTTYLREISNSKVFRELYPLRQAHLELFRHWYFIPIRELIASPQFKEDPVWIAEQVFPSITPEETAEALKTLLALGLVERAQDGRLVQSHGNVTTGDEVFSVAVAAYHCQMLELATRSIESVNRFQRDISGVTVLVSEPTFLRLKEMVQNFRRTVLAEVERQDAGDKTQTVYQIGIQLFPLTKVERAS